jgi:hypothetical protein
MGLDIFCRADIANALLAVEEASSATAAAMLDAGSDPARLRAYRQGYRAALTAVALAFGLSPREESRKPEITFGPALGDLSEIEGERDRYPRLNEHRRMIGYLDREKRT